MKNACYAGENRKTVVSKPTLNGELLVVIQKKQGAPSSKDHLEALFGNCEIVSKDKGYYILKSIKTK